LTNNLSDKTSIRDVLTHRGNKCYCLYFLSSNPVRAFVFGDDTQEKESGGGADCHKQPQGHWIVDSDIANPMSVYEQYRKSRTSWGIDAMGSVVVEVELTNGMIGVGISIGGDAACYIVEKHLARFAEGQDPTNVELIWDQCWRSTMNYGRKGIAIQVHLFRI
jgi:L-rhamnonate dehydratase